MSDYEVSDFSFCLIIKWVMMKRPIMKRLTVQKSTDFVDDFKQVFTPVANFKRVRKSYVSPSVKKVR